ncbi:MAG: hypothetical protein IKR53_05820 [Clostridia bacterium]|nr:hypothetical protein [Clostridia bacterium]
MTNIPNDPRRGRAGRNYVRAGRPAGQRPAGRVRYRQNAPRPAAPEPEAPQKFTEKLTNKFNTWRLSFSVNGEDVAKTAIIAFFIIFFSVTQTTLLARLRPFGATPDLLLPFVVAVGVSEREKWGGVTGLISAFIIDALGGVRLMLLPLLYVPAGIVCGLLTTHRFRDSFSVIAMYTLVTSVLRSVISVIIGFYTVHGITLKQTVLHIALPELLANIVFAVIPHLLVRLTMRPFHKTRAERTSGM